MPKNLRGAFTLIEVLATITVIGLLIALLLPAIQSAREASRRTYCLNNLRQLGLALNGYASDQGCMPAFGWTSIHASLLPYLEQQTLHGAINFSVSAWASAEADNINSTALRFSLSAFLCPSDALKSWGGTNYAGNAGCGYQAFKFNGPFTNRPVGIPSITDGASRTVAFAEILRGHWRIGDPRRVAYHAPMPMLRPDQLEEFGRQCRDFPFTAEYIGFEERGETWLRGGIPYTMYNHVNAMNGRSCENGSAIQEGAWSGGSLHPGGGHVVFVDGHARFVRESIDLQVWRAAGSRDGGEVADLD
ncbi:MAG: hypothetical protein BGO49_23610 [Planctomycetales bacterium 71-10]|nr:MAG: hypothetical protein BGO49_23610 [Planctomycetales bacterium 71-10]